MSQLTPNSKLAIGLGSALGVAGALLYAGWFANGLLRDIKEELGGIRSELKEAAADRWTGRDMRDYSADLRDMNTKVMRSDTTTGLLVPDARKIHRSNLLERQPESD